MIINNGHDVQINCELMN